MRDRGTTLQLSRTNCIGHIQHVVERSFGVTPQVECDGRELALPRDTEGLIIMNIPSYMGGVDLWASGRPAPAAITAAGFTDAGPQSMSDQRLEVCCFTRLWTGFC